MNQKLQKCLTYLKTKGSHGLHAEAMRKPSNNPLPPVDENRHLLKLNGTALALGWPSVGILVAFNCLLRTGDLLQLRGADIMMNNQPFTTINLPDTINKKKIAAYFAQANYCSCESQTP